MFLPAAYQRAACLPTETAQELGPCPVHPLAAPNTDTWQVLQSQRADSHSALDGGRRGLPPPVRTSTHEKQSFSAGGAQFLNAWKITLPDFRVALATVPAPGAHGPHEGT